MPRPFVHPSILAAKGVPFPILGRSGADGEPAPPTLCYSFAALMRLEEEFGSIGAVLEVMEQGEKGQAFGGIVSILAAGFVHEPNLEDGRELSHAQSLAGHLDPAELEAYTEVLAEAFSKAFPDGKGAAPADPQAPPSPGGIGITSPPFTFAAPTPSSGA